MTPSPQIEAFIKGFEACRLTGYLPTPNDVPTIGWGSTGPDIYIGQKWTQAQADGRFDGDLKRFGMSLTTALGSAATTQGQYDAMLSLAYNVGMGAFARSTLLRKHVAGDFDGAAAQFPAWNKQNGQPVAGLTRRRAGEMRIYKGLPA